MGKSPIMADELHIEDVLDKELVLLRISPDISCWWIVLKAGFTRLNTGGGGMECISAGEASP